MELLSMMKKYLVSTEEIAEREQVSELLKFQIKRLQVIVDNLIVDAEGLRDVR